MKIMVINGPNINMLGIREKEIYGTQSFKDLLEYLYREAGRRKIEIICNQSNNEGDIIDWIQEAYFHNFAGIIINPAAYTHTSLAIADAIKAISPLPVIEVHISDIHKREKIRQTSLCAPYCHMQIAGKGFEGYALAMDELLRICK